MFKATELDYMYTDTIPVEWFYSVTAHLKSDSKLEDFSEKFRDYIDVIIEDEEYEDFEECKRRDESWILIRRGIIDLWSKEIPYKLNTGELDISDMDLCRIWIGNFTSPDLKVKGTAVLNKEQVLRLYEIFKKNWDKMSNDLETHYKLMGHGAARMIFELYN